MENAEKGKRQESGIHLNKWFLDFVGDDGTTMIFYAAKLTWKGWSVPYTSVLTYHAATGLSQQSRFYQVHLPEIEDGRISWSDTRFGVKGRWRSLAAPLKARLFESDEGHLDWHCFQPVSEVELMINGRRITGRGYAEQLILTAAPWKIPMDELRWGRYGSDKDHMVWIELKDQEKKRQWVWYNGEKQENVILEDDQLYFPAKNLRLELNRCAVLESEKKIFNTVKKLIEYLPGFNKIIPSRFLMADEYKWLSRGKIKQEGQAGTAGWAIHELVKFKRS